jgi:hypothetical protein
MPLPEDKARLVSILGQAAHQILRANRGSLAVQEGLYHGH